MASSARIEELKKKFDENPRRYFAPLANEFRKLGDFDQAILICQEFLPQQPGHMSGHIVYGQALFEARRLEEARGVFETALTLDPENLIALRHLGDICREGGDLEGARYWYRRVLEADPRNEEIASLLSGLDEPASVSWTAATPTSSPTVDQAPADTASWLANELQAEPVIEQPLETVPPQTDVVDFEQVVASSTAASSPATEDELLDLESSELPSASKTQTDDLIESMGIERAQETPFGFEPSQIASETAGRPDTAPLAGLESTYSMPEPVESARLVEDSISALELPPIDESFAGPPVGASSAPAAPRAGEPPPEPATAASAQETVFESFEMPIAASETSTSSLAQAAASSEPEAITDPGSSQEGLLDEPIEIPSAPPARPSQPAVPAPSAGGFVTETMAELYVTQGHIAEAIGVYKQLVGRYPGDEVLRARLLELESMKAAQEEEAPAAPEAVLEESVEAEVTATFEMVEEPLTEATSPFKGAVSDEELESPQWGATAAGADTTRVHTIRDFLSELVAYQPHTAEAESPNGTEPDTTESADTPLPFIAMEPEGESAPASAETLDEEWRTEEAPESGAWVAEPTAIEEPTSAELEEHSSVTFESFTEEEPQAEGDAVDSSVSGSIDALFSGKGPSDADEAAASLLARAFEPTEEEAPISGKPTRAAKDELSLDHVFRDRQANPDRGQPTFSFDQFFSQEASDRGGAAHGEPSTGAGAQDEDIQQFNAWLEGLKKT